MFAGFIRLVRHEVLNIKLLAWVALLGVPHMLLSFFDDCNLLERLLSHGITLLRTVHELAFLDDLVVPYLSLHSVYHFMNLFFRVIRYVVIPHLQLLRYLLFLSLGTEFSLLDFFSFCLLLSVEVLWHLFVYLRESIIKKYCRLFVFKMT